MFLAHSWGLHKLAELGGTSVKLYLFIFIVIYWHKFFSFTYFRAIIFDTYIFYNSIMKNKLESM